MFGDKDHQPGDPEVAEVLGGSWVLWTELLDRMHDEFQPLSEDWTFSGKNWGWSLRLKQKKRAVLYLTPRDNHFVVGFALGQKAVDAASKSGLPRSVLELIESSRKYAEGRAVRLEIRTGEDVRNAAGIAAIKMEN